MNTIKQLLKKLLFYTQITLVLIYVTLEELVWDRFARPVYRYIKYLKPFEKLEQILSRTNKYVVLALFLVSLIVGEGLGLLTPIVALKGYVILSILIYGAKLLIAAFAFWVFNTQKRKLLSFKFIAYLYDKVVFVMEWIKSTEVYKSVIKTVKKVKIFVKVKYTDIKNYILNRFWR